MPATHPPHVRGFVELRELPIAQAGAPGSQSIACYAASHYYLGHAWENVINGHLLSDRVCACLFRSFLKRLKNSSTIPIMLTSLTLRQVH